MLMVTSLVGVETKVSSTMVGDIEGLSSMDGDAVVLLTVGDADGVLPQQ